ncbi:polysaccharide deacetylase family protein [Baekduia sp.]|uniref:polysaccharide deacetylase family protein n=1 Tax=Baekduia sp. TaxID=2600305 RepID=UPI002DFC5B87|nr:polysaccharide deacetylase family protein [Baekduia sp.]
MSGPALIAGAIVAAGGAAAAGEAATYAAKRREIAALRARCRQAGVVSLTFDDGPGPELTPRLLELLKRYDAHATFFALGRRAQVAPEILDRVAADGHEIGCHSLLHHNAWKTAPWAALADIANGYATLAPWVAADGRFRPPSGKQTLLTRRALRRRSAPVAWWTIDSGDTFDELPAPDMAVQRARADGGGVVLLHDHSEARPAERIDFVLDVTERLLVAARADGLAVRPLREL